MNKVEREIRPLRWASRTSFALGIGFGLITAALILYTNLAGGFHSGSEWVFIAELVSGLTLLLALASLCTAMVTAVIDWVNYRGSFPWVIVGTSGALLLVVGIAVVGPLL